MSRKASVNCLTVDTADTYSSQYLQLNSVALYVTYMQCSVVYVPALVVEAAYAMSASSGPPLRVYPPFFEGERERGIV